MQKYIHLTFLIAFIVLAFFIYKFSTYTYITAQFKELRPIKSSMPVYYKGLIVGRAKEAKHNDTFSHTLIKLVLYPKNLLLPSNTTVLLKKEKKKHKERDFLELIYPKEPTKTMLSNGSKIDGIATVDVDEFLSNRHPNELEEIKEDLAQSAKNLNYALSSLGMIFDNINEILEENKKNIFQTTKNVENMTIKIDKAIKQKQLENILSDIENSSNGVADTLNQLNQSYPNIDSSISQTKDILCNINAITCGIRKTLSQKFGILRLFFGQVVK